MPELPEVETVKNGLNRLIVGKKIIAVEHDWLKSFPNEQKQVDEKLINSLITDIQRRGKTLNIILSTGYVLVVHLKMTGQLVFRGEQSFGAGHPNDSLRDELPDKSTRVIFYFSDGSKLFFNDQRKFGWIKLLAKDQVNYLPLLQKMGPEPLDDKFSKDLFIQRIKSRKTNIKAVLLDQSVIAGVGNIYADECLWGAKINPAEKISNIPDKKLAKLYEELIFVLKLSIEKGGSTDKNYVDAEGKKGSYLQFARVFRRENQPCSRCGSIIFKTRVAGRGTHFCPECQKIDIS